MTRQTQKRAHAYSASVSVDTLNILAAYGAGKTDKAVSHRVMYTVNYRGMYSMCNRATGHREHVLPLTDSALSNVAERVVSRVSEAQERHSSPSSNSLPPPSSSCSSSATDSSCLCGPVFGDTGRPAANVLSATRRHLFPSTSCRFFHPSTSYIVYTRTCSAVIHIHVYIQCTCTYTCTMYMYMYDTAHCYT